VTTCAVSAVSLERPTLLARAVGSGEGAFESRAVGGLAVRRQHELDGLVEQRRRKFVGITGKPDRQEDNQHQKQNEWN